MTPEEVPGPERAGHPLTTLDTSGATVVAGDPPAEFADLDAVASPADWDGDEIGLLIVTVRGYAEARSVLDAWRPHLASGARVAFLDARDSRAGVGRFVRSMPVEWHGDIAVVEP